MIESYDELFWVLELYVDIIVFAIFSAIFFWLIVEPFLGPKEAYFIRIFWKEHKISQLSASEQKSFWASDKKKYCKFVLDKKSVAISALSTSPKL